jgi:hypothetical protein
MHYKIEEQRIANEKLRQREVRRNEPAIRDTAGSLNRKKYRLKDKDVTLQQVTERK